MTKIEPPDDPRTQSIQSLVTKVMGQQSIHANEAKPATLTITPVGTGNRVRQVIATKSVSQPQQPDTTEGVD